MNRVALLLSVVGLLLSMPLSTLAQDLPEGLPEGATAAEVVGHVDGDKITVELDGEEEEVLLLGIDAPELGDDPECFAQEAADRVEELVPEGSTIYLEADEDDRDDKDRLLRYLWVPGEDGEKAYLLNTKLVREGYAGFDPRESNDRYDDNLEQAEEGARERNRGLWADCGEVHAEALRCEPVPQQLVDNIAFGIKPETGATLRGAQAVRSDDFEQVWLVAADLEGRGLDGDDQIAVWATNELEGGGGLILSVGGFANEFSDWGDGGATDAEFSLNDDGADEVQECVKRAID